MRATSSTPFLHLALLLCTALLFACIRPPEIVLVDRATALENQAGGSYQDLEKRLLRQGVTARAVPLTPDDLLSLGVRPPALTDEIDQTEADRMDQWLQQRCVGEARDGTLVETRETCRGTVDRALLRAAVDRTNRARQQLFRFLQGRKPETPAAELRRTWRAAHLRNVVCGGWVQGDDERWEAKKC